LYGAEFGHFGNEIRNTWKVLKCAAEEGWRRPVWKMKKCSTELRRGGII